MTLRSSLPRPIAHRGLHPGKNKAEKLQRIRKAAPRASSKHGYDDTTMRDIAARAEIGFGTLFTYASDKRDLLFLIFNDELDTVVARAFEQDRPKKIFSTSLSPISPASIAFLHRSRSFAGSVTRDDILSDRTSGRAIPGELRSMTSISPLSSTGARAGQIATARKQRSSRKSLLSTFAAEIRRWIAVNAPDLKKGLTRLRHMLALQITGLAPRRAR